MNIEQIILKATQLIKQGKSDFANKTNLKNYSFPENEYFVCYDKAIKLLLDTGFIFKSDKKIQSEFYKLIPEPKEFTNEKENFINLYSNDENLRLSAAKNFSKLARAEGSIFRGFLFSYPKTFDNLFPALQDTNLKVIREIIATIGCAYQRYFNDPRAESELYKLFSHKDREILLMTIIWTQSIKKREKFTYIFSLMQKKQSTKILAALCGHFGLETETDLKIKVQPILLDYLKQKINEKIEYEITRTIMGTLDENTIPNFLLLTDLKKDKKFSKSLMQKIDFYCSKERIDFLKQKLFD